MAQERNNVERFDRINGADSTGDEASTNLTDSGTEHIKDQIEETRNQMGETIDAIQDKLSFANLSEQVSEHVNNAVETAKDAVYDATIGKAANIMKNIGSEISGTTIVKTVKANPLPFALIGLGAGLLAYQSYAGSSGRTRRLPVAGMDPRRNDENASFAASARETLSGVTEKVSNVTGTALDKVSGAVETAYSGAGTAVHDAYEKVGHFGMALREQYDTQIEDHPLAVGAVALALGAAVGMAIPSTRYEGELLGNARQELIDKAQSTASDLIDKTKEAVTEAGRNFTEQAKAATE